MKPRLILDEIKRYLDTPEAIVLTGMRRTGKATLLQSIFEKIDSLNKLYLDLEKAELFASPNFTIRSRVQQFSVNIFSSY